VKRIELFNSAMKQDDAKPFNLMSMTLDNQKILDETYDLTMRIHKVRERHTKFDMHNVFTVIKLDDDGKQIVDMYDLCSEYAAISVDMVTKSNTWYNTYPKDPTYRENLALTFEYLEKNMTDGLFEKVFEEYDGYPAAAKGGPLLFIIVMHTILSNMEESAFALQNRIKTLKLTNIPGEDVSKAVSLICGALVHLCMLKKVPDDLPHIILKVFQTSSVVDFNALFK
jgi:hypothetical protein